jgi:hypothetical protein
MRGRIKEALISMAYELRAGMPAEVGDDQVGVVLVSHGTPYVPAHPAFGWQEGEIFSDLVLTEDLFHEEVAVELPWATRTGRMNYASPSIDEAIAALEDQGITHVMMLPSAFPTAAIHTMWHVAEPAVGRAVTPEEGVVTHERDTGTIVYHTARGYADLETGRELFRNGLEFIAEVGVLEALQPEMSDYS